MLLAAPRAAAVAKRASILSELRANAKQSDIQTCFWSLLEGTCDKRQKEFF